MYNRCPKCRKTPIFYQVIRMHPSCAHCGYVYERERGYFLGALVIGYILGALSCVPTLVVGVIVLRGAIFPTVALASLQVIVLAPLLTRFSRLAWIHLDNRAESRE